MSGRVMSHIWMLQRICRIPAAVSELSHVTHMNESLHAYEWVMSRIWMSHVTHVNEPCRRCGRVLSHIWIIHVTHVHEIESPYMNFRVHFSSYCSHSTAVLQCVAVCCNAWVMSHKWDMTHLWNLEGSCSNSAAARKNHVWQDSFKSGTWLIYACDMTHSHVWSDTFTRVAWLICTGVMTRYQKIRQMPNLPRTKI